jgi:hypothetical protein
MKKSNLSITHSVSALTLASLVFSLAACDQNTDRRSPKGAALSVKCEKGFNVTNQQLTLATKNLANQDVVVRTMVLRDDVSDSRLSLSHGNVLGQKSVQDTQKSNELMSLTTDCKALTAKYVGVGAPDGLSGRIVSVTGNSIGLINGRKDTKFYQTITIEKLKPALTTEEKIKLLSTNDRKGRAKKAHAAKNAPAKPAKGEVVGEGVRIRITENGDVRRVFEAVQIFEKKSEGQNIVVSKESLNDIAIVLEGSFPEEIKLAMAAAPKDSSEIVVNTLDLAHALELVSLKIHAAKQTPAAGANQTTLPDATTPDTAVKNANTDKLGPKPAEVTQETL